MEIERKFTIKKLPEDLQDRPCSFIEQAYLCTEPVVRVRRENDSFYMTYKGKGLMAHEEYNLPLTRESYEHLKAKADGIIISKKRYIIPIEHVRLQDGVFAPSGWNPIVELDVFEGEIAPLVMAEVEFPDEETAKAYIPEDWFAQDVTADRRYHNSNMSKYGFQA